MNLLLEHGAQVNETDSQGDTPLHLAAAKGNSEAAAALLAHGASVTAKNHSGHTPIAMALAGGWQKLSTIWSPSPPTTGDRRGLVQRQN